MRYMSLYSAASAVAALALVLASVLHAQRAQEWLALGLSAFMLMMHGAHIWLMVRHGSPRHPRPQRFWTRVWLPRFLVLSSVMLCADQHRAAFQLSYTSGRTPLFNLIISLYDQVTLHGYLPPGGLMLVSTAHATIIWSLGRAMVPDLPLVRMPWYYFLIALLPYLLARYTHHRGAHRETSQPSAQSAAAAAALPPPPAGKAASAAPTSTPATQTTYDGGCVSTHLATTQTDTTDSRYTATLDPVHVCLKLNADLEDLTPEILTEITRTLKLASNVEGEGPALTLIDLGVREGCIQITLHMARDHPNSPQQAPEGEVVRRLAAAVAPVLPRLMDRRGIPRGEVARVQWGRSTASCYYTGGTERGGGWQVLLAPVPPAVLQQIKLGVACPVPTETVTPRSHPHVALQVQVWGLGQCGLVLGDGWSQPSPGQHLDPITPWGQAAPAATASASQPQQLEPAAPAGRQPPTPAAAPAAAPVAGAAADVDVATSSLLTSTPRLQLLARCGTHYWTTHVQSSAAGDSLWEAVVVAEHTADATCAGAALQPVCCARHPGVPEGSLLQPVVLELWYGDQLLDSVHTLTGLRSPATTAANTAATATSTATTAANTAATATSTATTAANTAATAISTAATAANTAATGTSTAATAANTAAIATNSAATAADTAATATSTAGGSPHPAEEGLQYQWWGAGSELTTAGVRQVWEVCGNTWRQGSGADRTAVMRLRAFVHDLTVWQQEVRECVLNSGRCVARKAGGGGAQRVSQVTCQQRAMLFAALRTECRQQARLKAIAGWVEEQAPLCLHGVGSGRLWWRAAALRTWLPAPVAGYGCHMCDHAYQLWLRQHLCASQLLVSCACAAALAALAIITRIHHGEWSPGVGWGLLPLLGHAACSLPQRMRFLTPAFTPPPPLDGQQHSTTTLPPTATPTTPTTNNNTTPTTNNNTTPTTTTNTTAASPPITASAWSIPVFLVRLSTRTVISLRVWSHTPAVLQWMSRPLPFLVSHVTVVGLDQMLALAWLPPSVVSCLGVWETLLCWGALVRHEHEGAQQEGAAVGGWRWGWLGLAALVVMAPRLLVDGYLRHRVWERRSAAQW